MRTRREATPFSTIVCRYEVNLPLAGKAYWLKICRGLAAFSSS
jgi:hypothetical protein